MKKLQKLVICLMAILSLTGCGTKKETIDDQQVTYQEEIAEVKIEVDVNEVNEVEVDKDPIMVAEDFDYDREAVQEILDRLGEVYRLRLQNIDEIKPDLKSVYDSNESRYEGIYKGQPRWVFDTSVNTNWRLDTSSLPMSSEDSRDDGKLEMQTTMQEAAHGMPENLKKEFEGSGKYYQDLISKIISYQDTYINYSVLEEIYLGAKRFECMAHLYDAVISGETLLLDTAIDVKEFATKENLKFMEEMTKSQLEDRYNLIKGDHEKWIEFMRVELASKITEIDEYGYKRYISTKEINDKMLEIAIKASECTSNECLEKVGAWADTYLSEEDIERYEEPQYRDDVREEIQRMYKIREFGARIAETPYFEYITGDYVASVIVRTLANSINQPYFSTIIIEDDWESQEDGGYTYIYEDELEDLNKNLRNIETYSSQYQVEGVGFFDWLGIDITMLEYVFENPFAEDPDDK